MEEKWSFQQMMLEQLNIHKAKDKKKQINLEIYLTLHEKYLIMNYRFKCKTKKLLGPRNRLRILR